MRVFIVLSLFLNTELLFGQYRFTGEVAKSNSGKSVYLSLVEDYRKASRIYLNQIIRKTKVDSLGFFQFEGDNLLDSDRIYRIHVDGCFEGMDTDHFLGECQNSESILFIAHNQDTLHLPTSFENQPLCTIASTNLKASLLLEIDALKEAMAFDFMDFPSEANKKLNLNKWFSTLQQFGADTEEPLAELYIYDFLSDRRNKTYRFYLQDVSKNPYYNELSDRLQSKYPNTSFTTQYEAEISTDKQLASFSEPKSPDWNWILGVLLFLSVGANIYFFISKRTKAAKKSTMLWSRLTPQEQKIVEHILEEKSNKEIAASLFVSHSTVKTHINNLYKKLEVSSREEVEACFKK
ncbi:helix-turn-helix transcriptional regulator [Muricauda sp. JGD-17]|uniref:Helix-turn-helix transcriptional regulator n=1 Tax=Flagellimonas ochracea TaxID=2696472 RepID=A0A964WXV1_9FLAO|nr:helix-turn-helix transcriptional regulator [Allomuricauda ochracea]NAY92242.1 helix-turn-helix transcriptional regulator [Allomuricauda ochracea]